MRENLSLLGSLRGGAASYVLLYHLNQIFPFQFNLLNYFFRFGQEAVIVFFILSGFVIVYSTDKETSFTHYFIKRFRRIYPLFIIALLLSFIVLCINRKSFFIPDLQTLLGNVFNLQDFYSGKPGVWFSTFAGNLPLWSLSYEWWFYMLFYPVYKFIPSTKQIFAVILTSILGLLTYKLIPNQISLFLLYFLIWWSGVELGKIYIKNNKKYTFGNTAIIWSSLLLITLLWFAIFCINSKKMSLGLHPILEMRHFLSAFVIVILGLLWYKVKFKGRQVLAIFNYITPISFAIYIYHYPLLIILQLPVLGTLLMQKLVLFLVLILFSILTEIKFQRVINRLVERFMKE